MDMNNEPVAWMMENPQNTSAYLTFEKPTREMKISHQAIPLYTHPAKTLTEIIEKNKPEIEKANAYIKSLKDEIESLKAKTLTDEEKDKIIAEFMGEYYKGDIVLHQMISAILRKAQKK
jgi:hypothetical protein